MMRNFFLALVVLLYVNCWYYSTSDSLPPYLKTIYMNQIVNKTAEFGLAESMTDQINRAFVDNGRLKIVDDPDDADLILSIEVTGYVVQPLTFGDGSSVNDYQVSIRVNVECKNTVDDKILWSSSGKSDKATFDYENEDEGTAKSEVVETISNEIVTEILTVW